ncbi:MAG: orotate phosphoribosyltransferase [Microgenomates group bacterium]
MTKRELLMINMFKINAIKFGNFKMKSGLMTPVYVDLRVLVSAPKVLKEIAHEYVAILNKLSFKRMVGLPYTALPIVANIAAINNKPWIYMRKEIKEYGTKKAIEGAYNTGEKVVMIDDMITNGLSKVESLKPLEENGLKIKDIVVLVDREQGGRDNIEKKGYNFHCVFTLTQWLKVLLNHKKISKKKYDEVIAYLEANKIKL